VGALEALALFSGRGELFTHLLSPSSTNTAPQIPPIEKTPEVTPVAALPTQGKPTTTPAASPKQREFRDKLKQGGNAPVLLELKGGTVELGSNLQLSPDEQPKYKTTLAPFALGKYEITQAEYALYAAAMNTPLASVDAGTRPVTAVTWQDAQGYATWLSAQTGKVYRLPSEAEWEYAVSGGQQANLYWWGMEPKPGMANCFNCGTDPGFAPMPVGQFAANPFGLYDMTGNVREWVQDCYVNSYRNRALAKAANCAQRSVRGGGYDTPMNGLRSSKRDKAPPESQSDNLGFRIARDL
jgi:formylglycine-generating enzyme required for sulfatase activity